MRPLDGDAFLSGLLPAAFVDFVEMAPPDLPRIAAWIRAGRLEGAYRQGLGPTPTSLVAYQGRLRRRLAGYRCLVIRYQGRRVGYVDFGHRAGRGEVFGLYLEPAARRARLGAFALRVAVAHLRLAGATSVEAEVYATNDASLAMCRRVGLAPASISQRRGDHQPSVRMRRDLGPLPRLGPSEGRYGRLQGVNLVAYHLAVAEAVTAAVARLPGVDLVLGLGSLARGFGDIWSDVDLGVLARGAAARCFWRGERWIAGVSIDLYPVDLEVMPPARWDEARRQAFEESVVLHERRAGQARALARAVGLRPAERRAGIERLVFQMAWLGFMPRAWLARVRHGYRWALPPDLWLRRGHLPSAHVTIDRVVDMLYQVLFLQNRRLVPDQKWRRFLVEGLPQVPAGLAARLRTIDEAPRTEAGFRARARALHALLEATVERLQAERLLAGDVYARFVQEAPDYDPTA